MPGSKKDVTYYLALTYPYELTPCEEGGYFARHPEFEGCAAQGETAEDALANLNVARELWIEARLEEGARVPEPPGDQLSGRLMLRVPLRLHAKLEQRAAGGGLSLNRLLNEVLFNHANGLPAGHALELAVAGPSRSQPSREGRDEASLEKLVSLPYPYLLTPADEGGYVVEHADLPGCTSQGETATEAMRQLDIARELWIESRLEDRLPVPDPLPLEHTGIISLRMPPELHYLLARDAARNGVSLNQWLGMALAEFMGGTAVREATMASPASSLDHEHETIQAVVPMLRRAFDSQALELLERLPKNRAYFLTGLIHLERREFHDAFQSFSAAYIGGLNFTTAAVAIYRSIPDRLRYRQVLDLISQLSQALPGDTSHQREVYMLLATWFEGIRENPIRQEEWFRWGRERRPGQSQAG
ncbi:MAG TPA: toxin-antitoxin system HicB family antitoxin [Thermoanaerobaculia bacterium]|nr:toxin-antitoxin system HicB family antitoxin [Thermoanaerobaculia bacterium]